jgi:hypothetical protein
MGTEQGREEALAPSAPGAVPDPNDRELRLRLDRLRDIVHSLLSDQFGESVHELQQVQRLLRDAALRLIPEFRTLSERAREGVRLARNISECADSESAEALRDVVGAIDASSRGVTQSLQFEDVANQLLDHIDRRLGRIELFAKDMALLRAEAPGMPLRVSVAEIEELERKLEHHRGKLAEGAHKAVMQESVEQGSVDLF